MTGERYTLDANVLIYAISSDAGDKGSIARALLAAARAADCILTVQTLGETFQAVRRKQPQHVADASVVLLTLSKAFPVVSASGEDFEVALELVRTRPVQWWDAMLWATARRGGCTTIVTEDMQDRPVIGGVRYLNPFAADPDPELENFLLRR